MGVDALKIKAITEFGEFNAPLRNIRAQLSNNSLVLDLIPSLKSEQEVDLSEFDGEPEIQSIIEGGSLVLESNRFLRLEFDFIEALLIREEFADHSFPYDKVIFDVPNIGSTKSLWPLLYIVNSPWKSVVQDYRLGTSDDPIEHIRILSMTTVVDVLSFWPSGQWIKK